MNTQRYSSRSKNSSTSTSGKGFKTKHTGKDGTTTSISLCIVGATGRFGRSILSQITSDIQVSGAVSSDLNHSLGRRLDEIGLHSSKTVLRGASQIREAASAANVVLFVSKPEADLVNIPKVVALGKRVVVGTTGFSQSEYEKLSSVLGSVPSLIASNFSIGANLLFKVAKILSNFSDLYDYSIVEQHHKMKSDAPSGTAKTLVQLLNHRGAFPKIVTDRFATPKRSTGEVEVVSLRGGGVPGIHQLILAGDHEMIRAEHLTFSREAGAKGALLACRWIAARNEPGIYTMEDALGLKSD